MKNLLLILVLFVFTSMGACFADDNSGLRDYDGVEIPKGSFIPVISAQEISTQYTDVGTKVKFISTSDLFLYETIVIPQNTEFYGFVEKVNEPVVGTNGSMVIRIAKLRFVDGFEIAVKGYIYMNGSAVIGGEITAPETYVRKPSFRQGYKNMIGYVPGPTLRKGEHKVIASGADLMIMLVSPLYITHTVTH